MKHLLFLMTLIFFASCVEQIEPIDENAEPVKIEFLKETLIQDNQAQVSLELSEQAVIYLEYGKTFRLGQVTAKSSQLTTRHTITLKNLQADTLYYYKAIIVDRNLNKIQSEIKPFKTLKERVISPTPGESKIKISAVRSSGITHLSTKITWKTDLLATGIVEFKESGASSFGLSSKKVSILKRDHIHTLANLKENTTYSFRVRSESGSETAVSQTYQFKTLLKPAVVLPAPIISENKIGNITENSALITWKTDQSVKTFLEYGTSSSYGTDIVENSLKSSHQAKLTSLKDNTVYYYRLKAVGAQGKETISPRFAFRTLKKEVPQNPSLISATLVGSQYQIKFSLQGIQPSGGFDNIVDNKDLDDNRSNTGTTHLITGLDTSKKHCFKVQARFTQYQPAVLNTSNEICVAPKVNTETDLLGLKLIDARIKESSPDRIEMTFNKEVAASSLRGFQIRALGRNGDTGTVSFTSLISKTKNIVVGKLPQAAYYMQKSITLDYDPAQGNLTDLNGVELTRTRLFYVHNEIKLPKPTGKTYYVSTSGNNKNDGRSPSRAWRTLAYAASGSSPVRAGDTVYIKAGNYGNERVSFGRSGVLGKPISFIGYKNTPGDITKNYYQIGSGNFKSSEMPYFKGPGYNVKSARGFLLSYRSHLVIKNLQIQNYYVLIDSPNKPVHDIHLENLVLKDGTTAIRLDHPGGNHNIVFEDIFVMNSSMTGIVVMGGNNYIGKSRSYATLNDLPGEEFKHGRSMDYHYGIAGKNNVARKLYAEHVGNLTHTGHGIAIKANSVPTEHNLVEDSSFININGPIEFRHRRVKYNMARRIKMIGKTSRGSGGVHFRDGASHNVLTESLMENLKGSISAIAFYDTTEDGGYTSSASYNVVKNSVIKNCENVIRFGWGYPGRTFNNKIINNTFINNKHFYRVYPKEVISNNVLANNIIVGTQTKVLLRSGASFKGWSEIYNNFYNNKFSSPKGNGNISVNPKFQNESKGDYRLMAGSQCIDAGKSYPEVLFDQSGKIRTDDYLDLGAFEK